MKGTPCNLKLHIRFNLFSHFAYIRKMERVKFSQFSRYSPFCVQSTIKKLHTHRKKWKMKLSTKKLINDASHILKKRGNTTALITSFLLFFFIISDFVFLKKIFLKITSCDLLFYKLIRFKKQLITWYYFLFTPSEDNNYMESQI